MTGGGGGGGGIYTYLNDLCIKMGSDDSHYNVLLNGGGQRHWTVSTDDNF